MMKLSIIAVLSVANPAAAFAPPTVRTLRRSSQPLHYWLNDHELSSNNSPMTSSDKGAQTISSTASTSTTITTLEARVKACLMGPSPCDVEYMELLCDELEKLQNECTEECMQTAPQCDLAAKEERDMWMQLLNDKIEGQQESTSNDQINDSDDFVLELEENERIVNPSLNTIQALMERETDSILHNDLSVLTSLYSHLEQQMNACTEDATQTNAECDLYAKEQREDLMNMISDRITLFQAQTTECLSKSKDDDSSVCYQICDVAAIQKTLDNLQELSCLCTEEGFQTATFCNLDVKEERDELMERLRHQLSLAHDVTLRTRSFII